MDDNTKKAIEEIVQALEEAELQEIVSQVRLIKDTKIPLNWASIGIRIVKSYHKAILQELGQEAAAAFLHGIMTAAGN